MTFGTHVFEAHEKEPDLCNKCGNSFANEIHLTSVEAKKLEQDWLNPNLHKFEVASHTTNCARCGKSAIMHGSIPGIDAINPQHYKSLPNGLECIEVTQWFSFNLGNAIKYCWRAGKKSPDPIQDLQKAIRYLEFEIERIKNHGSKS